MKLSRTSGEVKDNPAAKLRVRMAADSYQSIADQECRAATEPVEKRKGNMTMTTVALAACVILLITTTSLLVLQWIRLQGVLKVCQTPDCISLSATMLAKMNTTVSPCTDFYHYACGRAIHDPLMPPDEKKWGTFAHMHLRNVALVKQLLDKSSNTLNGVESTALKNAKSYFVACMNITAKETQSTKPLLELIKSVGSWSVTNDSVSGTFISSKWSLATALAQAGRYGVSPLFGMGIIIDRKDTTKHRIGVDQDGLTLHYKSYTDKNHRPFIELFTTFGKLLGGGDNAAEVAEQVWQFESTLAKVFVKSEDRTDPRQKYHLMSLAEFQTTIPDINIFDYLKQTFGRIIPLTEKVLVEAPSYLKKMNNIVKATPDVTLANYITWRLVRGFDYVLSEPFDLAKFKFDSAIYGVRGTTPKWRSCIDRLSGNMLFAVGALFVEEHFSSEDRKKTEDILRHIRDTFSANLPNVAWMDESTKASAEEKAKSISQMIGYPDLAADAAKLDKHYEKLSFLDNDAFENEVRSSLHYRQYNLEKLGKTPDPHEWHMGPATVNAYYSPPTNAMVFPAGILQQPFYDPTFPMAVNFGAIGSIMGHELTHAFDNTGRLFDKAGNMKSWWTDQSSNAFKKHTQCMVNQYNEFTVGKKHINGKVTLGENIADNGGLKTSYHAYMSWLQKHDDAGALLPALNMTNQQLFFLSFAQVWCTYYTPEYALLSLDTDPHSYTKYRVIGTLSNTPQFAKAFACPANSKMNPSHRCAVW
ncbi:hypothetical protein NP493_2g15008 [Ridgeia piscesae]|uniref:Endothelin-converting enzyme 1 n=1 Tax=Ridgeia piscesae TaxID=27915 RepID=A0AAD9ULQ8_RIDPI|nr:hypothetical protein NP493_2g15008 [Ridgeia piscesae]